MEYVSMQMFIRYASKQCINNYQIHSWPIIAFKGHLKQTNLEINFQIGDVLFYML